MKLEREILNNSSMDAKWIQKNPENCSFAVYILSDFLVDLLITMPTATSEGN